MSTTLDRPKSTTIPPTPENLLQPLVRLQHVIRRYIMLEGLSWLIIFICLWSLSTFLLDWGLLFSLFAVDYIREGGPSVAWFVRSVFLGTLWIGFGLIFGYHFIYRLAATFSHDELALVLERRFPELLGDRLLTAVQLANPEQARKYDYSWDMVQVTTREASERVEQIPLGKAFNWSRLAKRLTLSVLLAMGGVATAFLATDEAVLWAERNFLLDNVFWPRAYILEVPEFENTEKRAVPYGEEQRVTIRAWKWVVATRQNAEGWRRLEWADLLPGNRPSRPWELDPPPAEPALFTLLPAEWQALPLDEVEVRLATMDSARRRELGVAVIAHLRKIAALPQLADFQEKLLPFSGFIPQVWREPSIPKHLRSWLTVVERLTPQALESHRQRLEALRPFPDDLKREAAFLLFPFKPPSISSTLLVHQFGWADATSARELLGHEDWTALPESWQLLGRRALLERIRQFQQAETAEAVGRVIERRLTAMFGEIQNRTAQSHFGRRRALRKLFNDIADVQLYITFESVSEDNLHRGKGKSGTQEVRRVPNTNDFAYIFKKIESPFRFLAYADRTSTPWYYVFVKPLPELKYLRQFNDEPGYVHNSNQRVLTGPHSISMIGSEWRTEAFAGSHLTWEADCYKPLRDVHVTQDQTSTRLAVNHTQGSSTFKFQLPQVDTGTLLLRLHLTDLDGITMTRNLRLVPILDREPVFEGVSFPVVNPKMITAEAALPLTATAADDFGLTRLEYEIIAQQMDRKKLFEGRLPFRHFQPVRPATGDPADFRWDHAADRTQARVRAGVAGAPYYFAPMLAHLPATGIWGLYQAPGCDISRVQNFEYVDPATFGPSLDPRQEYLDLRLLRTLPEFPKDRPMPTPPYRLLVRLVAADTRTTGSGSGLVRAAPQEGKSEQVFEFTVVDERTLLVEVGNKEEDLHGQSQDVVKVLQKIRDDMNRIGRELTGYKPEELRKVADDVKLAAQGLAEQRSLVRAKVLLPFRAAFRELDLNRCQSQVLERLDRRICFPLSELLAPGQPFDRAQRLAADLAQRLESAGAAVTLNDFTSCTREVDETIRRMEIIMKEMQKLIEFNQALKVLEELIKAQQVQDTKIKSLYNKQVEKELDP